MQLRSRYIVVLKPGFAISAKSIDDRILMFVVTPGLGYRAIAAEVASWSLGADTSTGC